MRRTDNSTKCSDGVSFLGIRTAEFGPMVSFIGEALGYEQTRSDPGFATFRTPTGQRIEVFSLEYPDKEHFVTGPVAGFEVADFEQSLRWLRKSGLEILSEPVLSTSGTRWVHFRGPDGNVYEFVSHTDRPLSGHSGAS